MDNENPARVASSPELQFANSINSPRPGIDGYYSGDGTAGSRSDESLLHRAIAASSAFGSQSVESVGWPKPNFLDQSSETRSSGNARSRGHGLYNSFSPSMDGISENGLVQSFSQIRFNSPTLSRSGYEMPLFSQPNGASDMDMNWRSPLIQTSRKAFDSDETFLTQVQAFPDLPIHIHKQIHQTSGNQIINHFDVNLLRVHDQNIVGSTDSVAVFTTKRDTDQCWLMAFMKKSDENALRFNRLLKPDLDYKIIGVNALEIDSSKLNSRETIKFIFNFGSMKIAAEFVQLLEQLKNKHTKSTPGVGRSNFVKETWRNRGHGNSLLSSALANAEVHGFHGENSHSSYSPGTNASRVPSGRFVGENLTVLIQNKNCFQSLGTGTLKILHNGVSFEKLVFLTGDVYCPVVTMQHYIYKWNEICIFPEHDTFGSVIGSNCVWTACAGIEGCPGLPKFHAFKITFGSEEGSLGFYNAFQTSIGVAKQIGLMPAPGLHSL